MLAALDRLEHLELILTAQCNLRCSYCYQNVRPVGSMAWATLRVALDTLLASRRPELSVLFHGGEPLLEFDSIRRAVAYVRRQRRSGQRIRFGLFTNGLRLTPQVATFLSRHRVRTQLSLDGLRGAQEHRAPRTFDRLVALLARIRRDQPGFFRSRLGVNMTLSPATLPGLADSVAFCLDQGLREFSVTPLLTHTPDWRLESIAELRKEFAKILRLCLRHARATGETPLTGLRGGGEPRSERRSVDALCAAPAGRKIAVGVDGRVTPCVLLTDAWQTVPGRFFPPRLRSLGLGAIDAADLSPRLSALPTAARATGLFFGKSGKHSAYGRCGECPALVGCDICPTSIGRIPGNVDPDRMPDFPCAFNRVRHEYRQRYHRAINRPLRRAGSPQGRSPARGGTGQGRLEPPP